MLLGLSEPRGLQYLGRAVEASVLCYSVLNWLSSWLVSGETLIAACH